MNTHLTLRITSLLLSVALLAPSLFLLTPQKAAAAAISTYEINPTVIKNTSESTITAIKSTLTQVNTFTSKVAAIAQRVNTEVLQPLAFVMSVGLLKAMTAGVIAFVIGKSNGTGQPQFVQNLQGTLQKVGDIQANAFFLQFGRNSNSPFAASITSSLRTNYLQKTSMAGFWAANRSTLNQASPNINAFLAGKWSQGGTRAWFALTTQPQNNPYTFYQTSQSQLSSVVSDAQATRDKVLSWGQGFMSWCGSNDPSKAGSTSISPDDCTNADGTQAPMQTPGTTIKATLDKVLGSAQDKLVQMGSVAKEINNIMKDVATVFQTVNLAQAILGGPGSGGLAGFGSVSSDGSASAFVSYNRNAFLGVNTGTVYQNGSELQSSQAKSATARVDSYEASWNTIRGAILKAAAALDTLVQQCQSETDLVLASKTLVLDPLTARANDSVTIVTNARTFIAKVSSEQNLTTDAGKAAYFADLQKLQDMPPTEQVSADMQQEVMDGSGATASSTNPYVVSGGSIIDQMNLIVSNAQYRQAACTPRDSAGGP